MPPRETEEIQISDAIRSLDTGNCDNIANAARMYKVSYQKLRARRLGQLPSSSRDGHNKLLSEAEEAALCLYLNRCIALGRPCKKNIFGLEQIQFSATMTDNNPMGPTNEYHDGGQSSL